jgi:hypothetical protein
VVSGRNQAGLLFPFGVSTAADPLPDDVATPRAMLIAERAAWRCLWNNAAE